MLVASTNDPVPASCIIELFVSWNIFKSLSFPKVILLLSLTKKPCFRYSSLISALSIASVLVAASYLIPLPPSMASSKAALKSESKLALV